MKKKRIILSQNFAVNLDNTWYYNDINKNYCILTIEQPLF
jgi:hypothetical protein